MHAPASSPAPWDASRPATPQGLKLILAIFALAVGGFGIGTTEFAAMGLLPNISEGMDVSIPRAGWLISAYAMGVVVGAPLLAVISAKMPRKQLLIALMIAFAVGNFLSVLAPTFPLLLASRFIAGLPHGAYFGIAALVAASMVDPLKQARAISMVMLGLSVANVIGVPLSTWLGQTLDWRAAFVVVAALGVLTATLVTLFVPMQPTPPQAGLRSELSALRVPQVWLTLLIATVGFGGTFAVYSYISETMTKVAGFGEGAMPLILALYGFGMVIGNIIGGRGADWNPMGMLYIGIIVMIGVLIAFHFAAESKMTAIPGIFLVSIFTSCLFPAVQMRLMSFATEGRSLASSLIHSAFNIANALGAWLGGLVIAQGYGYEATPLVGAVLATLGLIVTFVADTLYRRSRAGASLPTPTKVIETIS